MYKLLVHKDYSRRSGGIHFRERAATQQRDARRLEVAGSNDDIESGEPLICRQVRLTFNLQSHRARPGGGQVGSGSNNVRAGNAREPGKDATDEQSLLRSILVTSAIQRDAGSKQML